MTYTKEEKKEYNKLYYNANKCIHNKVKSQCKDCGGSGICEHGKQKSRCKDCGGSEICMHNKRKSACTECCGSQICEHSRIKSKCKDCGGSSICVHNKRKTYCKECGGSSICVHNKRKSRCKECGGIGICEHNKQRTNCKECLSPAEYIILLQRHSLNRALKRSSNIKKTQHSIDYLGCSSEYFVEFLRNKMTSNMTLETIHIDHIKPVSRFNLDNEEEFLACVHYTNFQPLLAIDNISKSNKWSEEDEVFWNENIKGKEYYKIYIPN